MKQTPPVPWTPGIILLLSLFIILVLYILYEAKAAGAVDAGHYFTVNVIYHIGVTYTV
jgi:hypothetical protein